jgi:hypothetical protein
MSEALIFALAAVLSANPAGAVEKKAEAKPVPVYQGERWDILELRADPSARVFVIAEVEEQNQCTQ